MLAVQFALEEASLSGTGANALRQLVDSSSGDRGVREKLVCAWAGPFRHGHERGTLDDSGPTIKYALTGTTCGLSYLAASCGGTSLDIIRRYVESQRTPG